MIKAQLPLSNQKKAIQSAFSKAAASYDHSAQFQRQVADQLMAYLPSNLTGKTILDVGCGTGYCSQALLKRGANVVALDLSHSMLDQAKKRCGIKNMHYVQGDAEQLTFCPNHFDVVISSLALQWCQDLSVPLKEMHRVKKKRGTMLFSTLLEGSLFELTSAWQQVDSYQHVNRFSTVKEVDIAFKKANIAPYQLNCQETIMHYDSALALMKELKGIGATHIVNGRQSGLLSKHKLSLLEQHYQTFKQPNHRLPATYQVGYGAVYGTVYQTVGEESS